MGSISRLLTMNNGLTMPAIGLGTYLMKGDALKQAIDYALFIGYRHIDAAHSYGNEKEVGEAIRDRIKSGTVKRSDLFVTTKVPCVYLARESAIRCAEQSREDLGLKQVDMLLIHQPWGNVNYGDGTLKPVNAKGERELHHYDLLETWDAFEDMFNRNWTRSIGLSNFNPKQIQRIWDKAVIKPSNLQLEAHAYWQQRTLQEVCAEKKIVMTAYSPMGAPAKLDQCERDPVLLEDPLIKQLSEEYRKSPGQILLNFVLQLGMGVLPKSKTMERIRDNYEVLNWKITKADFEKLRTLDNTVKYFRNEWSYNHPEFDENEPF